MFIFLDLFLFFLAVTACRWSLGGLYFLFSPCQAIMVRPTIRPLVVIPNHGCGVGKFKIPCAPLFKINEINKFDTTVVQLSVLPFSSQHWKFFFFFF